MYDYSIIVHTFRLYLGNIYIYIHTYIYIYTHIYIYQHISTTYSLGFIKLFPNNHHIFGNLHQPAIASVFITIVSSLHQHFPRIQTVNPLIWVNYNISLIWIKAIWGWFPLLTRIIVRSQWGRYNLPRFMFTNSANCWGLIVPKQKKHWKNT